MVIIDIGYNFNPVGCHRLELSPRSDNRLLQSLIQNSLPKLNWHCITTLRRNALVLLMLFLNGLMFFARRLAQWKRAFLLRVVIQCQLSLGRLFWIRLWRSLLSDRGLSSSLWHPTGLKL